MVKNVGKFGESWKTGKTESPEQEKVDRKVLLPFECGYFL